MNLRLAQVRATAHELKNVTTTHRRGGDGRRRAYLLSHLPDGQSHYGVAHLAPSRQN